MNAHQRRKRRRNIQRLAKWVADYIREQVATPLCNPQSAKVLNLRRILLEDRAQ